MRQVQRVLRQIIQMGSTKKAMVALFLGILFGSLFANIYGIGHREQWGLLSRTYIEQMSGVEWNQQSLWQDIAADRIRLFAVMILIGMTAVSAILMLLYLLGLGFCIGVVVSVATMQYGTGGLLFSVMSLFPHGIFYGLALAIFVKLAMDKKITPTAIGIAVGVMLLGITTEALMNPLIMREMAYQLY